MRDVELEAAEWAYEFALDRYDHEMKHVLPSAYRPEVIERERRAVRLAKQRLDQLRLDRVDVSKMPESMD